MKWKIALSDIDLGQEEIDVMLTADDEIKEIRKKRRQRKRSKK